MTNKQIAAARNGVMMITKSICDYALHLSTLANSKDWIECYRALTPEQFMALTKIDQQMWDKVVNSQDDVWKSIVQAQFSYNIKSQTEQIMEVFQ